MRGIKLVAVVVIDGAVEVIGARTRDHVDRAARVASSLRPGLRLRGKLHDGVHRHHDTSDAGNAALIHGRNIVPEIIIVHAVDLPVDLIWAGSVQRAKTPDVITAEARLN